MTKIEAIMKLKRKQKCLKKESYYCACMDSCKECGYHVDASELNDSIETILNALNKDSNGIYTSLLNREDLN